MRGRLGKRGLLVLPIFLITTAFVLAGSATAEMSNGYEPSEEQALLEIYLPNKAAIDTLISADVDLAEYVKKLDDGSVQVQAWLNDAERAELEAQGYQIGSTIQDYTTYLARLAEREAAMNAEAASHQAAEEGAVAGLAAAKQRSGLRSVAFAQAAALPELTINRVDYFQNYAGWFLSVEAFDQLVPPTGSPGSSGPVVSVSWKTPGGTYSNAVTMSRYIDPDPTPDSYLYNRILIRIGNASPPYGPNSPPVAPDMVRVGSTTGFSAEAPVRPWLGSTLPPHAAGYLSDFHTSYMDPTQVRDRFEALATEFPNISQLISLPHKSAGYQRKSMRHVEPERDDDQPGCGRRRDPASGSPARRVSLPA